MVNSFKRTIEKLKGFFYWHYQFKKPTVFFSSFEGQYNDNPKAISEYLHANHPEIQLAWCVSEKCHDNLPNYIIPVQYFSKEYFDYSYRSQVLVDNSIGFRWRGMKHGEKVQRWILSSKKQLNISTWHGTPIKKIGKDEAKLAKYDFFVSSCDYLISGCKYTYDKLEKAFWGIPVYCVGTPRNDILVNNMNEEDKVIIKKKLQIPADKKIVLYAPTFRDSVEKSGLEQMKNLDYDKLFNSLSIRFGGEWCFVFRVHHSVLNEINHSNIFIKNNDTILNGNIHDDMAEYLSIADVLITDYSGSIFDFALTGKPCFLFTPDLKEYLLERGMYIDIHKLPYDIAENPEILYNNILLYNKDISDNRIKSFNNAIGNEETGHASEIISNAIIKFIKTGNKENLL